jgi:adenosine deaminase
VFGILISYAQNSRKGCDCTPPGSHLEPWHREHSLPHTRARKLKALYDRHASISGPAALALASLKPEQVEFIRALPKAELHAHLNGSIPLPVLQKLFKEHLAVSSDAVIQAGVERLEQGVVLSEISDFFRLFPAIYALTSTPPALRTVAHAVLSHFLDPAEDGHSECTYLELRTGPRATPHMTRREYLEAVLDEVERYSPDAAAIIVSIDRAIPDVDMEEVVKLAVTLKKEGRRVVGLDLSGDPFAGDVQKICQHIQTAKEAGLCVTLHIAEVGCFSSHLLISYLLQTDKNPGQETADFLETRPDRLGHATFLNHEARQRVIENKIGVELCLSSNLLWVCFIWLSTCTHTGQMRYREEPQRSSCYMVSRAKAPSGDFCM